MAVAAAIAGSFALAAAIWGKIDWISTKIEAEKKKSEERQSFVDFINYTELSFIQASISEHRKKWRSHSDMPPPPSLRAWIANLRCVAYDMEDCISCCGPEASTNDQKKLYHKLTYLSESIGNSKRLYETLKTDLSQEPATAPNPQTPEPLVDLVGKAGHVREVRNFFRAGSMEQLDGNLKVILVSTVERIKADLGERVYNEVLRRNTDHPFSLCALISAEGQKNKEEILKGIIDSLTKRSFLSSVKQGLMRVPNKVSREEELRSLVGDQSYFIVVHHLAEELAKSLTSSFPENKKNSRVILVSAKATGIPVYSKAVLQDEDSLKLLLHKDEPFVEEAPADGHRADLPLALLSVCEVGSSSSAADEAWKQLSRLWELHVRLPHDYERLCGVRTESHLQDCLLYFAMFPKGQHTARGSLIRRWLAEGFVGVDPSLAHVLQKLIDERFIEPLQTEQHVKTCQPSEVAQAYITRKCESEDFIMLSANHNGSIVRRLSLHPGEPSPNHHYGVLDANALPRHLRTLAVSRPGCIGADSIAKCEKLRVLDLEGYPNLKPDQLEKICEHLDLLKYLSLRSDKITVIPRSIMKLQWLETLDVSNNNTPTDKNKEVVVPVQVLMLPKLQHLLGKFKLEKYWREQKKISFPFQMIEAKNLESLAGFVTTKAQGFLEVMSDDGMKKLRKVKIWFDAKADASSIKANLPKAINKFLNADNTRNCSLSLNLQECPGPAVQKLLLSLENLRGPLHSLKLSAGLVVTSMPEFITATHTNKKLETINNLRGITKLSLSVTSITLNGSLLGQLNELKELKYLRLRADTIQGVPDNYQQGGGPAKKENEITKVVIGTGDIPTVECMCLVARETALPKIEIHPPWFKRDVNEHRLLLIKDPKRNTQN